MFFNYNAYTFDFLLLGFSTSNLSFCLLCSDGGSGILSHMRIRILVIKIKVKIIILVILEGYV